jgi:hypothetical protein
MTVKPDKDQDQLLKEQQASTDDGNMSAQDMVL